MASLTAVIGIAALPVPAQEFFNMYGYVEMRGGRPVVTLCGDHAKHMNHSDTPDLIDGEPHLDTNVAARDIEAGEELTCDYHSFDLDAERKLGGSDRQARRQGCRRACDVR